MRNEPASSPASNERDPAGEREIGCDVRALWAAVAYATCLCVAWYVVFFATGADSGILDGVAIGLFALVVAGAAVVTGVLVGRALR